MQFTHLWCRNRTGLSGNILSRERRRRASTPLWRISSLSALVPCLRLMHGIMPAPSGLDIANTIKYFSQTLLTVLKDVPNFPMELLKNPEMDTIRMGLYPNLDYKGLYNSLIPLLEVAPLIQYGLHAFGQAILQCFGCLLPFLEHDMIDNLPYLTASSIAVLPSSLHQDIVNLLCFYILPFTITRHNEKECENLVGQSVATVLMMVFQHSTNLAHHCQLLECLMTLKQSILKDLLCVIAYGTTKARASAAKLLFYYWPMFDPSIFEKKGNLCKIAGFSCQRDMCPNAGSAEAAKVCYDHCISITFASDSPPPLYLCIECANEIHREHPNQMFFDILHPMQQASTTCENKNCRSQDKTFVSVCFSTECASYNGNHPIKYCQQCHNNRHNNRRGGDHVVHKGLPSTWAMDPEMQTYMVEAIVSLIHEAEVPKKNGQEAVKEPLTNNLVNAEGKTILPPVPEEEITAEDRQLLGKYGVCLLIGHCTPTKDTPIEILGRLLAMMFHWFHITGEATDNKELNNLEKFKTDHVCTWLQSINESHNKLFISCLLPHPPDYARVGGHWNTLASRTAHLKKGLSRLFCLVPYEVMSLEIWDYVMPHWMEAIVNDVPEKELPELKDILSKMLDSEVNPLGFGAMNMYHFVTVRFEKSPVKLQEQSLKWLQTLSMLKIKIPLHLLFSMFRDGITIMVNGVKEEVPEKKKKTKPERGQENSIINLILEAAHTSLSDDEVRPADHHTDSEHNLSCCILMLDILLQQMMLQDIDQHTGINTMLCRDICKLLKSMLTAIWMGCAHSCNPKTECAHCESNVMWHQLSLQLIKYVSPVMPAHPPDPHVDENIEEHGKKSPLEADKKDQKPDVVINMPTPEVHSVGGVLVHMPHVCSIMTATVETVSEQLDLAAIIPAEKVVSAVARAITLSETDVATATVQVAKPQVMNANDEPVEPTSDDDLKDFWQTSLGKFKFCIDDLPQQLQYIHHLLKELPKVDKPDILYYMLQCLNILCLNGDAFTKASKEHKGFFIWIQENLLIKNLWDLCHAQHSHICEVVVPLFLHCITLPAGSDVFWKVIQEEFHSTDWRVRFNAVEKVTVIARFMDSTPLRAMIPLQAALANAFCYLISSMDDVDVYVAQKASLYLGTIHDSAIKSLILCMETQFDLVIVDRPMVLQCLYQLHNSLSDRKILTWEFFLNRFDTLFIEAQIHLEKSGELAYLKDLRNTDLNSETFMRKLQRAQEALSQSEGNGTNPVKTLSASFGPKWPYKRTMSAPASMVQRHEAKQDGHVHSLNIGDDGNIVSFLHRIIDLEEGDRETMHLLVFLFMQFLSRSDQAYPEESDKHLAKTQSIVLRHLYLLLGYNQTERSLYLPPQRLRSSSVFSVYLSNLPQLLDQNHLMGWMVLPITLILLQYSPSPQYIASTEYQQPAYTLWSLEPYHRKSWLMSLVVLLYKYQYSQQPQCLQLQALVKIVLNTLDAQNHRCRRIPASIVMGASSTRSRDVSQPSLGTENEHSGDRMNTPPLSPMYSGEGQSAQIAVSTRGGKVMYYHKYSTKGMDTHWEEAVPSTPTEKKLDKLNRRTNVSIDIEGIESDLISTQDKGRSNNVQTSADEVVNLDETCAPLQLKSVQPRSCAITKQSDDQYIVAVQTKPVVKDAYVVQQGKNWNERKPAWSIAADENPLQSNKRKFGVQEGMKMMVAAPFLPSKAAQQNNSSKNAKNCSNSSGGPLANTIAAVTGVTSLPITRSSPVGHNSDNRSLKHENSDSTSETSSSLNCEESYHGLDSFCFSNNRNMQAPLQTPSLERLLPIGTQKPPALKDWGRSEDSPMSKAATILSFDSSKDCDSESNAPSEVTSPGADSYLELPIQERLLPIGTNPNKEITQLVEKVCQALEISSPTLRPNESGRNSNNTQVSKSNLMRSDENIKVHSSPRKLIKQVALESPPQLRERDEQNAFAKLNQDESKKDNIDNQRQRVRKVGPFVLSSHSVTEVPRRPGSWFDSQLDPWYDPGSVQPYRNNIDVKQSSFRISEECVCDKCSECGMMKEEYTDEEVGLCIIILGTYIHREPALAAPMLPEILSIVSKIAQTPAYPWQNETNVHLPGGSVSVAHQFMRCVLHQLAPNGVFIQMFQTQVNEKIRAKFFRSVSQALLDFTELNPIAPLQLLLESLNSKKSLIVVTLPTILQNVASYLECISVESGLSGMTTLWNSLLAQLEIFFRRIVFLLQNLDDVSPLLKIMGSVLKMPTIIQYKAILDPFSKVLSFAIQEHPLKYQNLVDLCYFCSKAFNRERDKLILCRMAVFELVQALKFKTSIPDTNFLMLINLVLQDVGGCIPSNVVFKDSTLFCLDYTGATFSTNISECMRLNLGDVLEFLTDFHTLSKLKSYCKGSNVGLNDDTLGGIIKSGIAQYLALEITRGNGRDNRAVVRYFPWLYNTSALQQGPKEFTDCIGHIRLLSWLLLGSLTHTALHGNGNNHSSTHCINSQPIPQEASCQIADHVQVVMTGFAEQPKTSILHMSSLFHAFILCQLWTVYLEQGLSSNATGSEACNITMNILFDFWGKVTPCILNLMSHSKMLSEMVSLHFLSMLEALLECHSTFLAKLLPLWTPILNAHQHFQLPGHLQVRLQNCENFSPAVHGDQMGKSKTTTVSNTVLLRWLQRLQFKMGQIELQSSTATQFYSL